MIRKPSFHQTYFAPLEDAGEAYPDCAGAFYKALESVMVDPERGDYRLDLWNLRHRLENDSSFRGQYRAWMEQCFLSVSRIDGVGDIVESVHLESPGLKESFAKAGLTDKELALLFNQVFEPKGWVSLLLKDTKRLRGENPLRAAFRTAATGVAMAVGPLSLSTMGHPISALAALSASIGFTLLTFASVMAEEASSSIRNRARIARVEIKDYAAVRCGNELRVPFWQRDKMKRKDDWDHPGF